MKRLPVFFLALALPLVFFGQGNYYWIKFKDKKLNGYSLDRPGEFLTQRSIDRRTNQGITLNETDLPLTNIYIYKVMPYIDQLVLRLKWTNLIVAQIDDPDKVDTIRSLPFVDSVDIIQVFPSRSLKDKMETTSPAAQITTPGSYGQAYRQINMLNGDYLHQQGYKGQGVIIAMMDNGFNNVNQIAAFDSVRPNILGTWDFVHNQQDVYTEGSHGTTTFSCLAANAPGSFIGTAPGASYYLFHTEDNSAEWAMEEYNWQAAAEMADSLGAQIFTTSLGYTVLSSDDFGHSYSDLTGDKTVITHAGNIAATKGILLLNSAGNEGNSTWYYIAAPADADSVIAVAAVDDKELIAGFSSRGPNAAGRIKPDLSAQGANVVVITTGGDVASSQGTSYSCPILAGCAACLWGAFPTKTAYEIKRAMLQSADRYLKPDNTYGYGIPDFFAAYLLLKNNFTDSILESNVLVFPNPFSTQVNILLPGDVDTYHLLEIFDVSGKKMVSGTLTPVLGKLNIASITGLQGLAAGEYVLRIDGDKKHARTILKLQ